MSALFVGRGDPLLALPPYLLRGSAILCLPAFAPFAGGQSPTYFANLRAGRGPGSNAARPKGRGGRRLFVDIHDHFR